MTDDVETRRTVDAGECVLSLAAEHGLPWQKIWQHPGNRPLREQGRLPNVLRPGDEVVIPALEEREETRPTGKTHKFRARGQLVELRLRVHGLDGPRKREPFHLRIGTTRVKGTTEKTDDNGLAVCRVPAECTSAVLVIGKDADEYDLQIGHLDPLSEATGVHGRLENMGFSTGGVDSDWDADSARAMLDFLEWTAREGGDVQRPRDARNLTAIADEYTL